MRRRWREGAWFRRRKEERLESASWVQSGNASEGERERASDIRDMRSLAARRSLLREKRMCVCMSEGGRERMCGKERRASAGFCARERERER